MGGIDADYNFFSVQSGFSDSSPDWAGILGRAAAPAEWPAMRSVAGRRILVTGAGGFIGSQMVRALAAAGAQAIVLLEIAEQKLFEIEAEMEARGAGGLCVPVLGSVCDARLLDEVFREHRPEIVLHAAALKHVPLMERNLLAAVETNSLGTWMLAGAAAAHGARQMILISTDKAVEPHSIMGASKRIAEQVMLAQAGHAMRATVVRLANVIGSPCSVGPVFAEQIACGGPVTVTHPQARRFFLTLQEVVDLLAQALDAEAEGILVPDPGAPVLIADLAQRMMNASGSSVPVSVTGLRPGDKIDESLIAAEERLDGPATAGLRRVLSAGRGELHAGIEELAAAVASRDRQRVLAQVRRLVPEYRPSALLCAAAAEAVPVL